MKQPLVTAIVSTYAAERFIRGCLDDLVAQTLFAESEILVIDSGSPERESAICEEYVRRYPQQVRVIRTEREPLYAAWNRAILLARGKYLTNANTDDRHAPEFLAVMCDALERHPEVALVYADQYVSSIENETFASCQARNAKLWRWPEFTHEELLLRCLTGSQPVWRRSVHEHLGYFDASLRIAGDYDMWLRIGGRHPMLHVNQPLGVFFESAHTLSGSGNRRHLSGEMLKLKQAHMRTPHWAAVARRMRKRLAGEFFGVGYQLIAHERDGAAAAPLIREAIRLDPSNLSYIKTYLVRCFMRKPA